LTVTSSRAPSRRGISTSRASEGAFLRESVRMARENRSTDRFSESCSWRRTSKGMK
jgi:hypothetical protein